MAEDQGDDDRPARDHQACRRVPADLEPPVSDALPTAAVALVAAFVVHRWLTGRRLLGLGLALVVAGAWLLSQPIRGGLTTWLVAAALGTGVGFLLPGRTQPALGSQPSDGKPWRQRRTRITASVAVTATVAVTCWIGANSAAVSWFGGLTSHGPRHGRQVAITFDDGPDVVYTPAVQQILDRYGVKATFFTVGKALAARPDISRALLDDGQLLGNHSYVHDYLRWLDPGYPELDRTQAAFARDLGVCPTFFRPPHGQHTPLMAYVVHRDRMKMVTWDVSADDWATHDGALVARRVLARVKPGSIILLHDGLDGKLHADRSVILTALPLILDGLRARGLQPVRLDQLLGKPGWAGSCAGVPTAPHPPSAGATPAAP
jgi:peptidoglycan/xylan/chitin deacetylase (PgdA/CDA1 family)